MKKILCIPLLLCVIEFSPVVAMKRQSDTPESAAKRARTTEQGEPQQPGTPADQVTDENKALAKRITADIAQHALTDLLSGQFNVQGTLAAISQIPPQLKPFISANILSLIIKNIIFNAERQGYLSPELQTDIAALLTAYLEISGSALLCAAIKNACPEDIELRGEFKILFTQIPILVQHLVERMASELAHNPLCALNPEAIINPCANEFTDALLAHITVLAAKTKSVECHRLFTFISDNREIFREKVKTIIMASIHLH